MQETCVYKYTRAEIIAMLRKDLEARGVVATGETIKYTEHIRSGKYVGDEEFGGYSFAVTREK